MISSVQIAINKIKEIREELDLSSLHHLKIQKELNKIIKSKEDKEERDLVNQFKNNQDQIKLMKMHSL